MSTPTFDTISVEGGLLSMEYLHRVMRKEAARQGDADYGVRTGLNLRGEIHRGWKVARALREKHGDSPAFAEKFLQQVLELDVEGYTPIRAGHYATDDQHQPTHLAKGGAVPIVIAPTNKGLDVRQEGLIAEKKITPFRLAQIHLNGNKKCQWGIACDGNTLRLLRDSTSITRAAYIEADLHRILEEGDSGHYSEFGLLYLMAHHTRFGADAACVLEQWREESVQTGIRAHAGLRHGVEEALKILGRGFLRHPDNEKARQKIRGLGGIQAYYEQLLWLVYRLIFLLVTEDRDLLQGEKITDEKKKAYCEGYSVTRLRARANQRDIKDPYDDLWEGLKCTFDAMGGGVKGRLLGLPALGGLFDKDRCQTLQESRLRNEDLLNAIYHLSWITMDKRLARVNYRDMGADELGSIYESLLELTPRRDEYDPFKLIRQGDKDCAGNARKTSGSYYTTPSLVEELISSTLQPALDKITSEEALLAMRVLDPSCGSGHFLIAAARSMAEKLILLRGETSDNPAEIGHFRRIAVRDVISHCICGVDKNPMALDLAKTALWLEGFDAEKPLVFLDHHLQCGDSLLGVLNLKLLKDGIPDDAYTAVTGDDKEFCKKLKAGNRAERKGKSASLFATPQAEIAKEMAQIEAMPENDLEQIASKRTAYAQLESVRAQSGIHVAADMYAAAFLMHKQRGLQEPPTSADMFTALQGGIMFEDDKIATVRKYVKENRVFHWWLRYPAVMKKGGFDVILANPPWERIKLQEKEFFAGTPIADAPTQSARRQMIAELGTDVLGRKLKQEYVHAKHVSESASNYIRKSRNYPLTSAGDVNTYPLFAELCLTLTHKDGAAGIIVPTNIATDDSTKHYFSHLIKSKRLRSLYDFENRRGIFPSVHRMFRFALMTIAHSEKANFMIFAHSVADLQDARRRISLAADHLQLVNPNTGTLPLYRTQRDYEICDKLYRAAPIFWREATEDASEANPWQVRFQAMFHMSGDSKLFKTQPAEGLVRLYESKYMHQYDHRWAGYAGELTLVEKQDVNNIVSTRYHVQEDIALAYTADIPADLRRSVESGGKKFWCIARDWLVGHYISDMKTRQDDLPLIYKDCGEKVNMAKAEEYARQVPLSEQDIAALEQVESITDLLRLRSPEWLMVWRNITNATNKLTLISSVVPLSAIGNSLFTLYSDLSSCNKLLLLSLLNSFVLNYVARLKISGTNFNYMYIKQIPVLPPDAFTEEDKRAIVPAVLELCYTAHDMKPFYDDIMQENPQYDLRPPAQHGMPFTWDPERRALLRAAIEARIAHKYGLTRDELRYILDPADVMGEDFPSETFRILKNQEIEEHGEYRTRRLVLEAYDELTKESKA